MMFRTVIYPHTLLILVMSIFATCGAAHGDDIDHEEVRLLTQKGVILPLSEIVAAVAKSVPGEVLKIELEREHGAYVYEFKILRPNGKVQEVQADAATAKVLSNEDDDEDED